ncbi:hypothetical protein ZOSMA_101G00680 [Zostera marina]|uniref:Glycine-rich protein n=1 Tax=Zostera marina TaxID=29655 RepID=A0A0K9Q5L1_ZOSMR|nr:hypothetical protein ZOSMA_101G00680 [Zostera marina]
MRKKTMSFSVILLLSMCVVLSVLLFFSSTVASTTNTVLNTHKDYLAKKKKEDFNVEAFPDVFGGRGFPYRGRGFPIRGRGYPIRRYPRGRGFIRRPDPSGECRACCGNLFNDQCTVCC